ncbi:MAG: sugar phosphate isomerase/epimerase [Firmicutes bacterium]|nr:sugar phosphate isomerase/epimerase [Bacillota bacterium]
MRQIKIGTIIGVAEAPEKIPKLAALGFECFEVSGWEHKDNAFLGDALKRVKEAADRTGTEISAVGYYGNPLDPGAGSEQALECVRAAIDNVHLLGTDLFTGFAGRVVDRPIEESIPVFGKVWGELAKRAESLGVRIGFENCDMDGDWRLGGWNIAYNPASWEMMFNEVTSDSVGLEWEPCHQMVQLIDPIPELRKWVKKVFHVHGKDATIAWDVIRDYGIKSNRAFSWHRTPGFGDSNWADIITILRMGGYQGNIDIEGFHDPVYRGELEWSGQVVGLEYLKRCRGGDAIKL